jgi:hypothetical protein
MSISGVSSSDVFQASVAQGAQTKFQQIQSQFQKVGQDLQSGNLTQAQADFATLSQELPSSQQAGAATITGPTNTLAKAFQALGQDLKAGNLAASQTDFATIQQDAQQQQSSGQAQGHHHHHGGSSQASNTLEQAFTSLGTALQSGNLSSAQQAYATFQSDVQQAFPSFSAASSGTGTASSTAAGSGTVNVTA